MNFTFPSALPDDPGISLGRIHRARGEVPRPGQIGAGHRHQDSAPVAFGLRRAQGSRKRHRIMALDRQTVVRNPGYGGKKGLAPAGVLCAGPQRLIAGLATLFGNRLVVTGDPFVLS
ncbi:MAG: hypothetical protein C0524_02585 [Rhodobacter sp.]|nr:hypothetical protein [Rhodobacter sp.]